jgi:hypothetical protein
MKHKLALTFATLLILSMAIVAFAYNPTGNDTSNAKASCTCCGDSCPMKSKDAKAQTTAATDAKTSCDCACCKGDSCPMKNKDSKTSATADAKASCDCCGDSCPMKGDHSNMSGMDMKGMDMKSDKALKDCPCCHHTKKTKPKPEPDLVRT